MTIRYLCLSDLHLGAEAGLLTEKRPGGTEPEASEVMHALVECLATLVASNAGVRPTLVLLGDVLEFGMGQEELAAMGFQRFMELTMAPGRELFDAVWYVPGNHDHHLWEGARETQYAEYVARREHGLELQPPWHATRMLHEADDRKVHSPLLTALLGRARPDAPGLAVATIYPNLAVRKGERCVVFHHGHFIEWPYKLFTMANEVAFGVQPPDHVGDLEADNFAWIDFLWSGVGRCGSAGTSIRYAYEHLGTDAEKDELLDLLAQGLARSCPNHTFLPHWIEDVGQELTFRALLGMVLGLADSQGRKAYYGDRDASTAHALGAREYVATYVLEQVRRECRREPPSDVAFVFGHTHRPREDSWAIEGFERPVRALNVGGWMHETEDREGGVGAAIVVLDDDLSAVSLRLYDEGEDLSAYHVTPSEPVASGEQHSALFARLAALLRDAPDPWRRLVDAVDRKIG